MYHHQFLARKLIGLIDIKILEVITAARMASSRRKFEAYNLTNQFSWKLLSVIPQNLPVSANASHLDTTQPLVTLDQLSDCDNFQHVSVKIKVLSITEVVNQENKQLTADATGSSKIVLWNENVDLFAEDSRYLIQGLVVRTLYQGSKYLSVGRDDINITPIGDIGEVQTPTSVCTDVQLSNCSVLGVRLLDAFHSCYSCSRKVLCTSGNLSEPDTTRTTPQPVHH